MATAVIYARFSPRARAEECQSIATQLNACNRRCAELRLHVTARYSDEAMSGSRADNRDGLQNALRAVCASKGALVVYSLSRLARSTIDAVSIADRLERAGAGLISLSENVDTTTAAGRMFYGIMAVIAQWEREVIAERTSDAMLSHQSRGRRMSARPPYGWRAEGSLIVEDEAEQQTIRQVVELSNRGLGSRAIVHELETLGVQPRGDRWHHTQIMRIVDRADRDEAERSFVAIEG